jgi:hypothetical protein
MSGIILTTGITGSYAEECVTVAPCENGSAAPIISYADSVV